MKRSSLTKKQKEKLIEYRQEQLSIGLSTESANRPLTEKSITFLYKKMEFSPPEFIWTDGPMSASKLIRDLHKKEGKTIDIKDSLHQCFCGQMDISWTAFYLFPELYIKKIYTEEDRKLLDTWHNINSSCGWWWPYEKVCVISERPLEIHMKNGQLHKDTGAAFVARDGFKAYFLNGVSVPQWLAETEAEKIDPLKFVELKNVEVRREFVRKVGIERIVQEIGATVLDKKDDYELLEIDLKGTTGKWPCLKMLNTSINTWHLEWVDKKCKTVQEALEWRNQSKLEPIVLT